MQKRLLLVEDEPNITQAIGYLLAREGWNVDTHPDGGSAYNAVLAKKPDVLVLDVMLPNKTGFEVLAEVRKDADFKDLPILMLTALGQKKDREKAEGLGATEYMIKPFSNAVLISTLEQLYIETRQHSLLNHPS